MPEDLNIIIIIIIIIISYLLTYLLTAIEFSLGGSSPYTTMNNLKNIGHSIKRKEKEFMKKVNFTKIQVCWEMTLHGLLSSS
jgi:uncharacterized ion transporter superfamily protein YfcC